MANTPDLVGAFTPYTCNISKTAHKVFQEATDGLLGVRYELVAVSQQLVAGVNYKFFCNSEAVTQFPLNGAAIVSIYKPLEGRAHVTHIQPIN